MDSCSCAGRDRIWGSGNQRTLPSELALREGPRRCWDTVAIVWPCLLGVDAYAAAGRAVKVPRPDCPGCERPMGFWSGYLRWVRYGRARRIWVRRATCRGCRVSHALLPAFVLARRLDAIAAIGAGLAWAVGGWGCGRSLPPWACRIRPRGTGVGVFVLVLPPWSLALPPWRSSWPGACRRCRPTPRLPRWRRSGRSGLGWRGGWGWPRRECGSWARW